MAGTLNRLIEHMAPPPSLSIDLHFNKVFMREEREERELILIILFF